MPVVDTRKLDVLEKRPGWHGRLFHSAEMTFVHWEFEENSTIHEHSHIQEEVWHVLEGRLEVTIDGKKHTAGPSMVAIVPSGVRHSVRTLTDGKAIVVDCPRREGF
jgi:quercetin dioxygenase-like cupin family protein